MLTLDQGQVETQSPSELHLLVKSEAHFKYRVQRRILNSV